MKCLVLRAAGVEDAARVKALLARTWHDTYDALFGAKQVTETSNRWHALGVLTKEVTLPNASFLVALLNDEVIGHAFALEQGRGVVLLSRLYVSPAHQRQRVGERLWKAVLERHPEAVRVRLIVEARNAKGLAFYGRQGFVVVGEIEEEGSKSFHMEKVINVA